MFPARVVTQKVHEPDKRRCRDLCKQTDKQRDVEIENRNVGSKTDHQVQLHICSQASRQTNKQQGRQGNG